MRGLSKQLTMINTVKTFGPSKKHINAPHIHSIYAQISALFFKAN